MRSPPINELARAELFSLRQAGVVLTDAEVVHIVTLANKAVLGAVDPRSILFRGRTVGNLTLYPLTLGAKLWLVSEAHDWFSETDFTSALAMLYAMAFSRDPEAFDFRDASHAKKCLTKWGRKITATESELRAAIRELTKSDSDDADAVTLLEQLLDNIRKDPTNLNLAPSLSYLDSRTTGLETKNIIPSIAILMKTFGGTREQWLWGDNDETSILLLDAIVSVEGKAGTAKDPEYEAYKTVKAFTRGLLRG